VLLLLLLLLLMMMVMVAGISTLSRMLLCRIN